MVENTQHRLDKVRKPRVHITYDVDLGNSIQTRELPFVLGILSDLSGDSDKPRNRLKNRKFIDISQDNFDQVMGVILPQVSLDVSNTLSNNQSRLLIKLSFPTLSSFDPLNVVSQIPSLFGLYNSRIRLKDMLAKLDGNDDLQDLLIQVMTMQDAQKEIAAQLGSDTPSPVSKKNKEGEDKNKHLTLDDFYTCMARDDAQKTVARELLEEFLKQVNAQGNLNANDPAAFINQRIQQIDDLISDQLNAVMHAPAFLELEGRWRGLWYLVSNTNTNSRLRLKILNVQYEELLTDLTRAPEFDQSQLFQKIYEEEYGTFGGSPYSCLIMDYAFSRNPDNLTLLEKLAEVGAAAHTPILSAASPALFDMDSFDHINLPRDLSKVMSTTELYKWNAFRKSDNARYVSLFLPRVLMRMPYGRDRHEVDALQFEEDISSPNNFCWSNPAWVMGERITAAFRRYGWTAAIRGVEGGGLVEDLPTFTFKTLDGDVVLRCPTETAITDRREKELSDLGFIALCHCKGTDYAAFFGAQTCQEPKTYDTESANANANLSARLPYVLVASRFAHYIKVMMRDKIGSFLTKENVSRYLNHWIANYILLNDDAPQSIKAQYPLREARIDVYDVPGKPGSYTAVVYLRPHFQMEELTASIRLVAALPQPARS